MTLQLPLKISLRDESTFFNFICGSNEAMLTALKNLIRSNGEQFIVLWGNKGVGKTHLLQACCHESSGAIYLPMDSQQLHHSILQGLEQLSLICIDDIHHVLGNPLWEEALLHFYNRARDKGVRLVVSCNESPVRVRCHLADLRSRLLWGLIFQLKSLTDEEKMKALKMRALNRGFELKNEVCEFLLQHYPRDMPELFRLLNELDHMSLIEKRKITIPFVKRFVTPIELVPK